MTPFSIIKFSQRDLWSSLRKMLIKSEKLLNSLTSSNEQLDDLFKQVADSIENLYVNWYLDNLGTNWATVSTLIDVDMSVGAFVGAAGNSGMVVGEYSFMKNKTAKLTFLADGAQIFVGDDVLTSGSGGAFPSGLVIGTLTAVQTEAGGQIEYGIVEPQCDLDSLVQVFIIKSFEVVE